MIFDAFFDLIFGVWGLIVAALPTWSPLNIESYDLGNNSFGDPIFGWLRWANYYLPVSEAITILGLLITLTAAVFTYQAIMWALTKIHVAGTGINE